MTTLCTYVVREDAGLAPNPFWGFCTLAVCTPNHQGTRLQIGDWIAGVLTKARGHRLLYVMQVAEILSLDAYYRDDRFASKRPDLRGDWQKRCGDNFYSLDSTGKWVRHRNRFHLDDAIEKQDTKYARVFIADRFGYYGREAKSVPSEFQSLFGGRGARVNHPAALKTAFIDWVRGNVPQGIHGLPNDNPDMVDHASTSIQLQLL